MTKFVLVLFFSTFFLGGLCAQNCDNLKLSAASLRTGKNLICKSDDGTSYFLIVKKGEVSSVEVRNAQGKKVNAKMEKTDVTPHATTNGNKAARKYRVCIRVLGRKVCVTISK